MTSNNKNKHMTLQERIEIQECLNKGMSFKAKKNWQKRNYDIKGGEKAFAST